MTKETTRKSDKKLIIFSTLTLAALVVFGFVFYKIIEPKPIDVAEKITLLSEYRNTDGSQLEIRKLAENEDKVAEYFENLVKEKKDFVLYVSLPICNGDAAKFKEFVLDFQRKNHISFYYLTSDFVKETSLYNTVKFFPSVIIYKDGKITNYLKYDSDEDKEFYKSYEGFEKWIRANVEF